MCVYITHVNTQFENARLCVYCDQSVLTSRMAAHMQTYAPKCYMQTYAPKCYMQTYAPKCYMQMYAPKC